VLIGVLTSASVWLMLSRNLVKFLFGLVLVSNVANLVIIVGGGFTPLAPALIGDSGAIMANALPQALVLTAIVIGFALVAFVLVLAVGTYRVFDTVDMDAIRFAEPVDEPRIIDPEAAGTDGVAQGVPVTPTAQGVQAS